MNIEITYCQELNYKPEADRVSAEINSAIDVDVALIPGSGGVFDVKRDGELIFSKHELGRFPGKDEIVSLLSTKSD